MQNYTLKRNFKTQFLEMVHLQTDERLFIDFTESQIIERIRHNTKKPLLIQAVFGRQKQPPTVIDATCGLGLDTLTLASYGCQIVALEKEFLLYKLLKDALLRAQQHPFLSSFISNIHLYHKEATSHLEHAEVILLDPMFGEIGKSRLVKRKMRYLQEFFSNDERECTSNLKNDLLLFEWAKQYATKKTVVKRAKLNPTISQSTPSHQIHGKSNRFDCYINHR